LGVISPGLAAKGHHVGALGGQDANFVLVQRSLRLLKK
jgi:hypothetical protein